MTLSQSKNAQAVFGVLRAARNGAVYGGKVRFLHALVISLLYRRGSLRQRLVLVFNATKQHAETLASFAVIYKAAYAILLLVAKSVDVPLSRSYAKFMAGCIGSWVVYLQRYLFFNGAITHQVTLYCFSRVVLAVGKILVDQYFARNGYADSEALHRLKLLIYRTAWRVFAVLTWGLVMMIYDTHPQYLQSLLRHSMEYIYNVEQVGGWESWRQILGL